MDNKDGGRTSPSIIRPLILLLHLHLHLHTLYFSHTLSPPTQHYLEVSPGKFAAKVLVSGFSPYTYQYLRWYGWSRLIYLTKKKSS